MFKTPYFFYHLLCDNMYLRGDFMVSIELNKKKTLLILMLVFDIIMIALS